MAAKARKTAPTRDRQLGLGLFGLLEILVGVGLGHLGILIAGVGPKLPENLHHSLRGSIGFFFFSSIVWITIGFGSIFAKRWARAWTLILSWPWLVLGGAAWLWILHDKIEASFGTVASHSALPHPIPLQVQVFSLGLALSLLVGLPLALILFYSSRNVKATCEDVNPQPGWTDQQPLPILGYSLLLMLVGLWILVFSFHHHFCQFFFGLVASGFTGAVLTILLAGFHFFLAWGFLKQKLSAWWACVIFGVVLYGSRILFQTPENQRELYSRMGFSQDMVKKMLSNHTTLYLALNLALLLGILFYLKRYFPAAESKGKRKPRRPTAAKRNPSRKRNVDRGRGRVRAFKARGALRLHP